MLISRRAFFFLGALPSKNTQTIPTKTILVSRHRKQIIEMIFNVCEVSDKNEEVETYAKALVLCHNKLGNVLVSDVLENDKDLHELVDFKNEIEIVDSYVVDHFGDINQKHLA